MSIDVRVPGDAGSVRAVAEWLGKLRGAFLDADAELAYIWTDSNEYWTGESGSAWRTSTGKLRNRATALPAFISDAMEVFHAYANRLERMDADFVTLLFQAGEIGLAVRGTVVLPPVADLAYCPGPGDPIGDQERYAEFVDLLGSYDDLARHVGTALGEMDVWIAKHIVALLARIDEISRIADIVADMTKNRNQLLADSVLQGYETFIEERIGDWREQQNRLQDSADIFRDQLRSGNPALRAAAEAADPAGLRGDVVELAEHIGQISKFSKLLPLAGGAIDVVSISIDVSQGGSLSSGVVSALGGMGGASGGAAVAVAAFGGSNPIGWAITGAVVGSIGAGVGARWLWEAAVGLDVRESIDDFFVGSPPHLEGYDAPPPRTR